MEGKQLNTETVLRAGMTLAKQLPLGGAENAAIICKILDTLLTEALAKVGESNETEAKILGECKKCVETVLPVVLSLLAQEGGAGAGVGVGPAAVAAAASAAAAPVLAQAEAAVDSAIDAAAAAALAVGISAPVVAQAEKALEAAVANALKTSSFFAR